MTKQRTLFIMGAMVIVMAIVGGLWLYNDWFGFGGITSSGDTVAPELTASDRQEIVYRIDPNQSEVRYTVQEIFAGSPVSTAIGTTNSIAGDVLINTANFAQSQVGTIVINIEHFESDSGLRDARIRQDFLESSAYPEAIFVPMELINFPIEPVMGEPYSFQMRGNLTIKETTAEAVWDVTATLNGDVLTGQASTVVLMSTFDVGPISIASFVETSDDVQLNFDFVAISIEADESFVIADSSETEAVVEADNESEANEAIVKSSDETQISQTSPAIERDALETTSDLAQMINDAQVVSLDAKPQVRVTATLDSVSGVNLRVELLNFVIAPEQAGQANLAGEGHAYLFVDGERYTRIVSEWLYINDLDLGEHLLTVALANNDGTLIRYDNDVVLSELPFVVD